VSIFPHDRRITKSPALHSIAIKPGTSQNVPNGYNSKNYLNIEYRDPSLKGMGTFICPINSVKKVIFKINLIKHFIEKYMSQGKGSLKMFSSMP